MKGELDAVINHDAPGLGVPAGALSRQQASLNEMRHAINSTLELQVPGYKAANETSSVMARRAEAVQSGTQYPRLWQDHAVAGLLRWPVR